MRIEIRTIPGKRSAQGIHNWTANGKPDGKSLNKTKNGDAGFRYGPLPNAKTGRLTTGLDVIIENPFSDKDIEALAPEWQYLKGKKQITRQEWLEVKHLRPKGFYTSETWIKEKHGHDEGMTFMQKFIYPLNDGTTLLDTTNVIDELAYYMFLTNYKYVAPSYQAYTKGLPDGKRFPNATHFIAYEDEDEEIRMTHKAKRNKATAALESEVMNADTQLQVAKSLNWHKDAVTPARLYNAISSRIEAAEPKDPNNDIDKFMAKFELLKDAGGRKQLKAESDLQDFLDARVLTSYKETYVWPSKGVTIGQRRSEAIEFLLDENKSPEVKEMKKELKAKLVL